MLIKIGPPSQSIEFHRPIKAAKRMAASSFSRNSRILVEYASW